MGVDYLLSTAMLTFILQLHWLLAVPRIHLADPHLKVFALFIPSCPHLSPNLLSYTLEFLTL